MKNSIFDKLEESKFREIIRNSKSISQVFNHLKLCKSGDQYVIFKNRVHQLGISLDHFRGNYDNLQHIHNAIPQEKMFQKETNHCSNTLKRRIIKDNLKPYKCEKCSNIGDWLGESLSLQLDHINGDRNDNRLDNLRFLCPNCHTQTSTYSGKSLRIKHICEKCGEIRSKSARICKACRIKSAAHPTKILWPDKESLLKLVWQKSTSQLAKELGVSDKAVEKRCKKYQIIKPPRGYWMKIGAI